MLDRFTGPKITLNIEELTETQEAALRAEGMEVEGLTPPNDSDTEKPAELPGILIRKFTALFSGRYN